MGGDIIQQTLGERSRNSVYKEASNDIIDVNNDLKEIAPVLRAKLFEALLAGSTSEPGKKSAEFIKSLPDMMIKDDKVTGRIAGAIAAKFIVNPKNKKISWIFILTTIVSQMAAKGVSKGPPAAGGVLSNNLKEMIPDLEHLDPKNPNDQRALAKHLIKTMEQLGVSVTPKEALLIAAEINRHPQRITNDFIKLNKAFEKFSNANAKP